MGRDLFVVCGGNALAHRLVLELVDKYQVRVAAIVPPAGNEHTAAIVRKLGPDLVVEDGGLFTDEVLIRAGVETAAAIAFVDGTEAEAIHAAMRSRALSGAGD